MHRNYVFCDKGRHPNSLKGRVQDALKDNLNHSICIKILAGCLGSHSFFKFGKTTARRSGKCRKDDSGQRGRWPVHAGSSSEVYESTYLPFVDAKVALQL